MRGALVLACASALGCSGDPAKAERERVLGTLAAHRATDVDPRGVWWIRADESFRALQISPATGPGQFSINAFSLDEQGGPHNPEQTLTGTLERGILQLSGAVAGSARLHLCRFGDEVLLLPESVRFETGAGTPSGSVFRRMQDDAGELDELKSYLPGPEDEVHPMRRVEGD